MSVEFKDYYAILGVDRSADDKAIKSAYRRLARKYHPDVAKGKDAAGDRFKEISEAYEVLSDPEKRRRYDTLGPDWQRYAQPGPGRSARRRAHGVRRGRRFLRLLPDDLRRSRWHGGAGRSDGWWTHQPRGSARGSVHAPVGARAGRPGQRHDLAGGRLQRRPQDLRVRGRRALRDLPRRRPRRRQAVRDVPRRRLGAAAAGRGREDPGRRAHGSEGPRGRRGRPRRRSTRRSLSDRDGGAAPAARAQGRRPARHAPDHRARGRAGDVGRRADPARQGLDEDPARDVERADVPAAGLRHAPTEGRRLRRRAGEREDRDARPISPPTRRRSTKN